VLRLEVLAAGRGDAMLLHYAGGGAQRAMLIDGGPSGTYASAVRPALAALRSGTDPDRPLRLDMVMVSHLDDDHINGILALFDNEAAIRDERQPPTITASELWVNVFDDVIASGAASMDASAAGAASVIGLGDDARESAAVVASIPQGRRLRDVARRLAIPINPEFDSGLVSAAGTSVTTFGDATLTVIGPQAERIDALRKRWAQYLSAKARKDTQAMAEAAAYVDRSVFNLSSIVAIARYAGHSVLLTGDARGDDLLLGLERGGLLKDDTIHVDVLKVPHHGSSRNVTLDFFRRVTADRYVLSGDGTHGNPDVEMLKMLLAARPRDDYELVFTYPLDYVAAFVASSRDGGSRLRATNRPVDRYSIDVPIGS
jgi:beta-lactamase superfamily II metal-dependent hydrolase